MYGVLLLGLIIMLVPDVALYRVKLLRDDPEAKVGKV
jgi:hypothetical protein